MKTIPQSTPPANTFGNRYQPRDRSPLVPVIKTKRKCPVCDHSSWCSVTSDGALAFCMRVSSGSFKTARNGAFLHRLIDTSPAPRQQPQPLHAPTVEDAPQGLYSPGMAMCGQRRRVAKQLATLSVITRRVKRE